MVAHQISGQSQIEGEIFRRPRWQIILGTTIFGQHMILFKATITFRFVTDVQVTNLKFKITSMVGCDSNNDCYDFTLCIVFDNNSFSIQAAQFMQTRFRTGIVITAKTTITVVFKPLCLFSKKKKEFEVKLGLA
jgi:hypothetical protein